MPKPVATESRKKRAHMLCPNCGQVGSFITRNSRGALCPYGETTGRTKICLACEAHTSTVEVPRKWLDDVFADHNAALEKLRAQVLVLADLVRGSGE